MVNFFYLDTNLEVCARFHGDKHLNKMQVEYAQIASSVWWILVLDHCQDYCQHKLNCGIVKKYIYKKSYENHPVVLWALKSPKHYLAIVELGINLGNEKRRRIRNMENLPKSQQRKWKLYHKSEPILKFCANNVPPSELFSNLDWEDPPKCMPKYLYCDTDGTPFSTIKSYRLYYSGNKVTITGLKWKPYVEEPYFLKECQEYIKTRPDIVRGISEDLLIDQKKREKRLLKNQEKKNKKMKTQ
jgi:hypothetical protein